MGELEDYRVFVGGLSWDTTDKRLEQAFRRVGKVLDAKIMLERDTGRPRGFGFVTFADEQSMEDAIAEFHNRELDGRIISVNKAQPKMMGRGDFGYNDAYDNDDDRGGYSRGRGGPPPGAGREDCFRCGKPGHWARECPLNAGGGGFPPRYNGGRSDRFFGGGPPYGGGRYGDRYRGMDRGRERYGSDRFGSDRYGDSFAREDRGGYGRGGMDRNGGGGPVRYDGGFRDRPGPYDRPSGRPYGGRY